MGVRSLPLQRKGEAAKVRLSNLGEGLTGRNPVVYKRTLAKPHMRSPCSKSSAGTAGKWHGALPYYKTQLRFAWPVELSFLFALPPSSPCNKRPSFPSIHIPFLLAPVHTYKPAKLNMRLPTTIAVLLALLATTSTSPLAQLSSRLGSSLLPRQKDPTVPKGTEDITITGEILPTLCVTEGRTTNHTAITINAVIHFFTDYLVDKIPPPTPDLAAQKAELPPASASINPQLPVTYTGGCDPAKPMYWAPLSGTYDNDMDVVVLNLEGGVRRAGFCGVMTRAAAGGAKQYQTCYPQQGT
ncbi:MAG: hypothetical protein LQ348_006308 [Seirophora lacunosa]|nr:MAG: hypothetical protein LQ348_006308 [Seirophora lacunosa]